MHRSVKRAGISVNEKSGISANGKWGEYFCQVKAFSPMLGILCNSVFLLKVKKYKKDNSWIFSIFVIVE